jgi:hypothetical protein
MSNDTLVKFATFGPNRGLTLQIGNFQFVDGICEVPSNEASAAASILCRYHDVCHAHDLEQKIAEYDTAHQNRAAAASFPQKHKKADAPKSEQQPETPHQSGEQQPSDDAPQDEAAKQAEAPQGEGEPEPEAKKTNGNGKKHSGKTN